MTKNRINTEEFGFYRISAVSPSVIVADCEYNTEHILKNIDHAIKKEAHVILFPQLSITSASCGDLFKQIILQDEAKKALIYIAEKTKKEAIISIIGLPLVIEHHLYNCSAVICEGKILGIVPLAHTFNSLFSSPRDLLPQSIEALFEVEYPIPFGSDLLFTQKSQGLSFSIGINTHYSSSHVILEPLAQPSYANSLYDLKERYKTLSKEYCKTIVFVNSGWGESTTDHIFSGESAIIEKGIILSVQNGFSPYAQINTSDEKIQPTNQVTSFIYADSDMQLVNKKNLSEEKRHPSFSIQIPSYVKTNSSLKRPLPINLFKPDFSDHLPSVQAELLEIFYGELVELQARGLAKRIEHTRSEYILLGISGGMDSTLALLVITKTIDILHKLRKNIVAITMPGFGTTKRTKNNALMLAELLGCSTETISLNATMIQHFSDINQDVDNHDITYQNAQARERTQILMDRANQINGLVVGTGDLSELALGWTTYNGDHMAMYGVNASLTKTLIREALEYCKTKAHHFVSSEKEASFKKTLQDILKTPISPELLPPNDTIITQETETILGPYILHDFFIYHALINGFGPKKILFLAQQTFKDSPSVKLEKIQEHLKSFYHRFFSQQFKRSCSPDGSQVSLFSFSPRTAWKMPSDASARLWIKELDLIE